MSEVKDSSLSEEGELKVEWAEDRMPVLLEIRKDFRERRPLEGVTVGFALHVTKETAALVRTLRDGGAKVAITSCNPLSTQDDVAAFLSKEDGIEVFAWKGETDEEYYGNLKKVLDREPEITIDDGGDLVFTIHREKPELIENIRGGCEETTTGIHRLRAMEKDGALKYPVMNVNDARTKHFFDNRYGTGQSTLDGILRSTNILFAGKTVVVAGYGWCGRGIAMRAEGMGAKVIVTEVDAVKALEATMDGYRVMNIDDAAPQGDIFITATGNKNVIREEHFENMKSGAVLANSGHFNVEIDVETLKKMSNDRKEIRENLVKYNLGDRHVYLLAEGRLVNLAGAEGHPSEVMDMSFANQALAVKYLLENDLSPGLYNIPPEIDEKISHLKLKTMGIDIDKLTEEQKRYLESWEEGT